MEAARVGLGYRRINLLSESAGTRLAMIYFWRHPSSGHRAVMIGANPRSHVMWYPETTSCSRASSVGVPIGLGIYLAWVDRDRSGRAMTVAFAAALAGVSRLARS